MKRFIVRIVFCWSDISGYIAACWRALSLHSELNLHVIAYEVGAGERNIAFSTSVMRGIDHQLLKMEQAQDAKYVADLVSRQKADAIVLPGWFNQAYAALAADPRFE